MGPFFVFICTSKYGWRPLPSKVDEGELTEIVSCIDEGTDRELVQKWYERDDNLVPSQFCLRKISDHFPEFTSREKALHEKALHDWLRTEKQLQRILRKAVQRADLTDTQKSKWLASVTEQEVETALTNNEEEGTASETAKRAFVIDQQLQNVESLVQKEPLPAAVPRFVNLNDEGKDLDREAWSLLSSLRTRVLETLPPSHIRSYVLPWLDDEQGISEEKNFDYIINASADLYAGLRQAISDSVESLPVPSTFEREALSHCQMCLSYAKGFTAREDLVEEVLSYCRGIASTDEQKRPLVVWGHSGTGKTSLAAKCAFMLGSVIDDKPIVMIRLCGTSLDSSSARRLLHSLCCQIQKVYADEDGASVSIPDDYRGLVELFPTMLSLACRKRPLVLVLDSLDQLSNEDQGRSQLHWLPALLPKYVRIVLTTLPDQNEIHCLRKLRQRECPEVEVPRLRTGQIGVIIDSWLKRDSRTLQESQRRELLEAAEDGEGTVLSLRLLYDVSLAWKSTTPTERLPRSTRDIIMKKFKKLEEQHSTLMVRKAFGGLSASRNGLTENELTDLCSIDDELLDDVFVWHEPPMRRLPQLVLARLLSDVQNYITERGSDGESVIYWYHRQFWEAAEATYLCNDLETMKMSSALADIFSGRAHTSFQDRGIAAHGLYFDESKSYLGVLQRSDGGRERRKAKSLIDRRVISELPLCLLRAKRWEELRLLLSDIEFLSAATLASASLDLVHVYNTAIVQPDIPAAVAGYLREFREFMMSQLHVITHEPAMLCQQALAMRDESRVAQAARLAQERLVGPRSLCTWVNKIQRQTPLRTTIAGHKSWVTAVAAASSSKDPFIVSGSGDRFFRQLAGSAAHDCSVRIWDALTGEELQSIACHSDTVTGIAIVCNDENVITCSLDGSIAVSERKTGEVIASWKSSQEVGITALSTIDSTRYNVLFAVGTTQGHARMFLFEKGESNTSLEGKGRHERRGQASLKELQTGDLSLSERDQLDTVTAVKVSDADVLFAGGGERGIVVRCQVDVTELRSEKLRVQETFEKTIPFGEGNAVYCLQWCLPADGKRWLLCGGRDSRLAVMDHDDGRVVKLGDERGHRGPIHGIVVIPSTEHTKQRLRIATCSKDYDIILWTWIPDSDTTPFHPISLMHGHSHQVMRLACSPDSSCLWSCGKDKTIRQWDVPIAIETGGESLLEHTGSPIKDCSLRADGHLFAIACEDTSVKVFRKATDAQHLKTIGMKRPEHMSEQLHRLHSFNTSVSHEGWVLFCAFSPNGQWLLSGDSTGLVVARRLYDDGLYVTEGSNAKFQHDNYAACGDFSDTGRLAAVGSLNEVVIYSVPTEDGSEWTADGKIDGHTNYVRAVRFCRSSRKIEGERDALVLATGCDDGKIRLFSVESGGSTPLEWQLLCCVAVGSPVWSLAFKPRGLPKPDFEGLLCAGCRDGSLWALKLPKEELHNFESELSRSWKGHDGIAKWCAFSRCGRWLISLSTDAYVHVYSADAGAGTGKKEEMSDVECRPASHPISLFPCPAGLWGGALLPAEQDDEVETLRVACGGADGSLYVLKFSQLS